MIEEYPYLRLTRNRLCFGVWIDRCIGFITLRGQIPGAEPSFQVIDIRSERLSKAAERNGGAVGCRTAIFATLGNFDAGAVTRARYETLLAITETERQ